MKKIFRTFFLGMVALLLGTALTSCSNDDEPQVAPEAQKGYVEFTLSRGADTRTNYAFNESTQGLSVTWAEGDKVVVWLYDYENEINISEEFELVSGAGTKTATFAKSDSQLADKSGDVSIFYAPSYTGNPRQLVDLSTQEGNLENLGKYDCFRYEAQLDNGSIKSPEQHYFLSIYRFPKGFNFGVTDADKVDVVFPNCQNTVRYVEVGSITIKDVSLTEGKLAADLYVAIAMGEAPEVMKVGDKAFRLPKGLKAGYTYTFKESDLTDAVPLTLEAMEGGKVTISVNGGNKVSYSINGEPKVEVGNGTGSAEAQFDISVGDKVEFFGNNNYYGISDAETGWRGDKIKFNGQFKIYGNIMSLIYPEDYNDKSEFGGGSHSANLYEAPFATLFAGNEGLVDASGLILPATELVDGCYAEMFRDCTSLTAAPELPAEELATSCYENMFYGCTSLETAPLLLSSAVPAAGYQRMFYGCTKLNSVTCTASYFEKASSTQDWLSGVASSGTFTKAEWAEQWELDSSSGIPSGWTIQDYVWE